MVRRKNIKKPKYYRGLGGSLGLGGETDFGISLMVGVDGLGGRTGGDGFLLLAINTPPFYYQFSTEKEENL